MHQCSDSNIASAKHRCKLLSTSTTWRTKNNSGEPQLIPLTRNNENYSNPVVPLRADAFQNLYDDPIAVALTFQTTHGSEKRIAFTRGSRPCKYICAPARR